MPSKKNTSSKPEQRSRYWLESAKDDWNVARHLYENGDYPYSLFFGHLTIEKILKAIYVERTGDNPPFTHRLVFLAEKSSLKLAEEKLRLLETITDFNLEARYPDEKFSFRKRCTKEFTGRYLEEIGGLKKWLEKQLKQSKL